ncbi:MAG TPA: hypothetical protein VGZ22_09640 [Isosphaeraceae bacterium]|jgi:hypothetical protein|nr:hypothetical protein [Isosphaeraceae bacterium]
MWDGAYPWAVFGLLTGFWKLVVIGVVTLVLYGRSGLPQPPWFRLLKPWVTPVVRSRAAGPSQQARSGLEPPVRVPWWHDRWFVVFLVLAATAIATWIVARMTITASTTLHH